MITFALNAAAFDAIAQEGAPSADSAEALANVEKIAGQRSHVLVTCAVAVAVELRDWFAMASRLARGVGDAEKSLACADAVAQIDESIRDARR